jgi:hypothetical protein
VLIMTDAKPFGENMHVLSELQRAPDEPKVGSSIAVASVLKLAMTLQ